MLVGRFSGMDQIALLPIHDIRYAVRHAYSTKASDPFPSECLTKCLTASTGHSSFFLKSQDNLKSSRRATRV